MKAKVKSNAHDNEEKRIKMKRVVEFLRNSDVVLLVRALLFAAVAAVVIGIVVLSLQIERLIKFLVRFLGTFLAWTFLIVGSWAVVIGFVMLTISFI
jgi:hypothetical protein